MSLPSSVPTGCPSGLRKGSESFLLTKQTATAAMATWSKSQTAWTLAEALTIQSRAWVGWNARVQQPVLPGTSEVLSHQRQSPDPIRTVLSWSSETGGVLAVKCHTLNTPFFAACTLAIATTDIRSTLTSYTTQKWYSCNPTKSGNKSGLTPRMQLANCPSSRSDDVIKHSDQKQLGEEMVYFPYTLKHHPL